MKAILVIDMPETCEACPLTEWAGSYCRLVGMFCAEDERPSWCPLKPMPKWREVPEYVTTKRELIDWGYDQCIAEILGDCEGVTE